MLRERLNRRKYQDVASRGLAWLWTHRGHFRIIDEAPISTFPMRAKPLLELAFLLEILHKNDLRYPAADQLRAFVAETLAGCEWHQILAYTPSNAIVATLPYQFCQSEQIDLPFERDYFNALLHEHFFDAVDRGPFRQMDYAHGLAALGTKYSPNDMLLWFSNTAFGRYQPVTRYSISDLYSLTHSTFYLTNMGATPDTPLLIAETKNRLHRELVRLAAVMVRGNHLDVLTELLLCCVMCQVELQGDEHHYFQAAIKFVQDHVRQDGTLPPSLTQTPKRGDEADTFAFLYHTCLVSVFLFSFLAKDAA